MAKKLVNFSKPKYTKDMTEEERAKADEEHTVWLIKEIVKSSPEMFGELSDDEIDKLVDKVLAEE